MQIKIKVTKNFASTHLLLHGIYSTLYLFYNLYTSLLRKQLFKVERELRSLSFFRVISTSLFIQVICWLWNSQIYLPKPFLPSTKTKLNFWQFWSLKLASKAFYLRQIPDFLYHFEMAWSLCHLQISKLKILNYLYFTKKMYFYTIN